MNRFNLKFDWHFYFLVCSKTISIYLSFSLVVNSVLIKKSEEVTSAISPLLEGLHLVRVTCHSSCLVQLEAHIPIIVRI